LRQPLNLTLELQAFRGLTDPTLGVVTHVRGRSEYFVIGVGLDQFDCLPVELIEPEPQADLLGTQLVDGR
jgi:hypothetical protein